MKATDSETAAAEAHLGITCHYIGHDWNMESICHTTMPQEDRRSAPGIAELEEAAARFEIPPSRFIAIVHGNIAKFEWCHCVYEWAEIHRRW